MIILCWLWELGFLLSVIIGTTSVMMQDVQEYCPHESFKAVCAPDEVVVMLSASYGRMRLGRCVRKDLGYVGCYSDVLPETDRLCSGRRQCDFRIPDLDVVLRHTQECMEELKSYLEASHTCLKVEMVDPQMCQRSDHVKISSPSGYIASVTSEESGCGTGKTPWILEQQPGQRINISLFDFASVDMNDRTKNPIPGLGREPCHAYAIIREKGAKEAVTICGGEDRERHVYMSVGNRVEIRVFTRSPSVSRSTPQFLLRFEAIGCPDLLLGDAYVFRRTLTSAQVSCKGQDRTWSLKCKGTAWNGQFGNCSAGGHPNDRSVVLGGITLSFEVSVIIISIIAFLISLCILIVGLLCLRKRRYQEANHQNTNAGGTPQKVVQAQAAPNYDGHTHQTTLRRDGNDYACILDMPLPPPPPSSSGSFQDSAIGGTTYEPNYSVHSYPRSGKAPSSTGTYHVYDISKSPESLSRFDDVPRYFELDPDNPNATTQSVGGREDLFDNNHIHPSRYST